MKIEIISAEQVQSREYWIGEISRLSGDFGVDAEKVEEGLGQEIKTDGIDSLLGHLRLCGAIPERYSHDSSEEKLYSKYTDVVIHKAYSYIKKRSHGFPCIGERKDNAALKRRSNQGSIEAK